MRFPFSKQLGVTTALAAVLVALLVSMAPDRIWQVARPSAGLVTLQPPSKPTRRVVSPSREEELLAGMAGQQPAGEADAMVLGGGLLQADRMVTLPDGRTVFASELAAYGFEDPEDLVSPDGAGALRRQLLERAGRLASMSDQPWKQLIMVALSYRQAQDEDAMHLWFDRAIGLAANPKDPRLGSLALRDVVKGLLAAGEIDRAEDLTQRIPDVRIRQQALAEVVRRLAFKRDEERALALVGRISDKSARALALRGMAEAEARYGTLADALQYVRAIPAGGAREQALSKVALARGKSGDASGAMRLVEDIGNDRLRDLTLMQLAAIPPSRSRVSPEILLGLLRDPQLRDESLLRLVEERAASARLAGATQAAARIENPLDYAAAMEFLTSLELQLGDIRSALKRAQAITVASSQTRALEMVAVEQVGKQGPRSARLTAELILEAQGRNRALRRIAERTAALGIDHEVGYAIASIDDPVERAVAYASVAKTTARRGQRAPARLFLQDATREIADLSDPRKSARALSLLATAHAETGDDGTALQVAAGITNVGLRDRTYQQLARHYANDYDLALAEESALAIEKATTREKALDDLARVLAGRTRATEALRKVRELETRRQQVKFLLEVAQRI